MTTEQPAQDLADQARITKAARVLEDARRHHARDPRKWELLVDALTDLANLRIKTRDYARAESLLREALHLVNAHKIPSPPHQVGLIGLLAYLSELQQKPAEAIALYQEALQVADGHHLSQFEKTAVIHNNLGMLLKKAGHLAQAEECYQKALAIFRETAGEETIGVAAIYNNLGVLYYSTGQTAAAMDMHHRALAIREILAIQDHDQIDLAQTYNNLAAVYKMLGDHEVAERCLKMSVELVAAEN